MTEKLCTVCLEEFSGSDSGKYPYFLPCTHTFHLNCIKSMANECGHRCPNCRRNYENMIDQAKIQYRLVSMIEKEKIDGQKQQKEFVILVKELSNKIYKLNVCYDYSEEKIYKLVQTLSDIPIDQFNLIAGGKNMKRDGQRILEDFGIEDLGEIYIVLRLRGGG